MPWTATHLSGRHLVHIAVAALFAFVCTVPQHVEDATPFIRSAVAVQPTSVAVQAAPPTSSTYPVASPSVAPPSSPTSLPTPASRPSPTATALPTPVAINAEATPLPPPSTSTPSPISQRSLPLLDGWPVVGTITQFFSLAHPALDIAAPYGSAIAAVRDGLVVWAGWRNNGGGYVVEVEHGDGIITGYNHLSAIWVGVGQTVSAGEGIGAIGCTGLCTGPHVHFTVLVGDFYVDPLIYL